MGQTVYVDLYFLINFSMDFLCFFLSAKLLSRPLPFWRTVIGSALGGIYANLALFLPFGAFMSLLIDIAACALICLCAFGGRGKWRQLPLYILVFVATSLVLGGVMTALFHLFNRINLPLSNVEGDGISVWIFAVLAIVSGICTALCERFFRSRTSKKTATLRIAYGGKSLDISALCDSGNLLCDPIGGKPCIVVDREPLRSLLPFDLLRASEKSTLSLSDLHTEHIPRVRLIPTQTATGEGILLAFRPDGVAVDAGNGFHDVNALIVLSHLGNTADGAQALLPPSLLI